MKKNNMKKIEVLAPAGSMNSLIPAVRCKADAVYIGADKFSARGNAENFNKEQLKEAVEYCHIRNVKVYLTVNTLAFDNELPQLLDLIEYAVSIKIDAFIVQDIGLASLIKKIVPKAVLHASTQMSVHNKMGAEFLKNIGFSRVVLARELSKEEIKEITSNVDIEVEVFIHGALCMSVSGQCYFSAFLGQRSGNRGLCAQPCRLPFKANGGTGHDLSLKDNCLIPYVNELINIGVDSLKIEGRMKRPEYVAAAVSAVRKAVDTGKVNEDDIDLLKSVFSRSGFTAGYYLNKRSRDMFGIRSKEDVISANDEILSKIRETYKEESKIIPVNFKIIIKKDIPIKLFAYDLLSSNTISLEGTIPTKAVNVSVDEEKCKQQLLKTGSTPIYCNNIECEIDKGLYVKISEINELRRNIISLLLQKRNDKKPLNCNDKEIQIIKNEILKPTPYKGSSPLQIRARFETTDIPHIFKNAQMVYVPINSKISELKRLMNMGMNIALEIPRLIFFNEDKIISLLKAAKDIGINDVLASNLGAVELAKKLDMNIHGGFGLNITNTASLDFFEKQGLCDAELSIEMKLSQISKLGSNIKRGIIAYGHIPLMLTRNCPIANSNKGCLNCKGYKFIKDRKNIEFPVKCFMGYSEILNSVPLYMADKLSDVKGVDFIVLRFSVENSVESEENFKVFNIKKASKSSITRGLYYRGVE